MKTPDKDKKPKPEPKAAPKPPRKKPPAKKRPGGQPAHQTVMNVPQPDPYLEARAAAMQKCSEYGLERVLDDIMDHVPLSHIALKIGVANSSFLRWMSLDPARGAACTEARKLTAQGWEERAEQVVAEAKDPFNLIKAKELAHHYRWRAACISPKFNPKGGNDEKKVDDPVAAMRELAERLPN